MSVVAWVAIVFVSILVHELGHALTARTMGAAVEIELNGVGGLTRWSVPASEFGPGRRALVAAPAHDSGTAGGGGYLDDVGSWRHCLAMAAGCREP